MDKNDRNPMETVLHLVYPPRCPVCDRILPPGGYGSIFPRYGKGTVPFQRKDSGPLALGVCPVCQSLGRPERVREPLCKKCGKPLWEDAREYCYDCENHFHSFREGRAALAYRGMEDAMQRFKNRNRREYAAFFGRELYEALKGPLEYWRPQVLVPVPVHRSRKRMRGYNQAELLGRELSRRTHLPMDAGLLVRTRKTRAQRELNDLERRQNVEGAFAVRNGSSSYKRLLLIDDIYTTGSTADAAAGALLDAGAEAVFCGSVCIGKGF